MGLDTATSTWIPAPPRRPAATLTFDLQNLTRLSIGNKGKGFPCLIPSVGPGADPGVQTVIHPAVGCHYFQACGYLPQSITAPWLVPSYTAW